MRPGQLFSLVALTMIDALSCTGTPAVIPTRVAQHQPVTTGIAEYDAFFQTVYAMQVAINESERVKMETIARLATALGMDEHTELDAITATIRDRVQQLQQSGVRLVVEYDSSTAATALTRIPSSAHTPAVPSQAEVEPHVRVEIRTASGALPPSAEDLVDAIRRAIRSALALKVRMDTIAARVPDIRATGERLATTVEHRAPHRARELKTEFEAAREFLDGAAARAQAQAQLAFRIAVRIQAAASVSATTPSISETPNVTRYSSLATSVPLRSPIAEKLGAKLRDA